MYTNLLVPVDLAHGDVGAHILKLARSIGGPEAQVTVLHVLDSVPSFIAAQIPRSAVDEHWAAAREKITALAHAIDKDAKVVIRQGPAANVILQEAETLGADAIVLGSHRPDLSDYLIGSTAARVVRHAQCSVVVDRSIVET
jgi:nucleotide-binding universal stress UspA family protein